MIVFKASLVAKLLRLVFDTTARRGRVKMRLILFGRISFFSERLVAR